MDWTLLGRCGLTLLFAGSGVLHFLKPEFYLKIMPPYIPYHQAAVALSGGAELLLAAGLWVPQVAEFAAWGLVALLIAVSPVHVYMAQYPERFSSIPRSGLYARLVIQLIFLFWAYRYTQV